MTGDKQDQRMLGRLSAVMDGEADEPALSAACTTWRDDEDGRSSWHAWHLIGDVMRSEDLASTVAHDSAFLSAFRARLAAEPVVLAPSVGIEAASPESVSAVIGLASNAGRVHRRRSWTASAAVAAGFVVVAGAVMVVQRTGPTPSGAPLIAVSPIVDVVPASTNPPVPAALAAAPVASDKMIRDAGLQQYLAAHKQFGGSGALVGMPSGFLRSATVETPSR